MQLADAYVERCIYVVLFGWDYSLQGCVCGIYNLAKG